MLKKSLFSPTRPWRLFHPPAPSLPRQPLYPETRLFPSSVLPSLRGSMCRGEPLGYRNHWREFSVRQDQFNRRTAHTKCGLYLLVSLLAAALLGTRRVSARQGWVGEKSGLFLAFCENILLLCHMCEPSTFWRTHIVFSQPVKRSDPATTGSVSSSHDKLNEMKRLKRQVGYEEIKDGNGVPNGTFYRGNRPTWLPD